jgi:8-oxo-dGTP diphosphatase
MTEEYMPIQATLCYLRKDGKILFVQRGGGNKDIHDGFFVVPGGRTECSRQEIRCERGIDCIVREFEDETGLKLIKPRLRAIATFFNLGRSFGENANHPDYKVEIYESFDSRGKLNLASDSNKNKRLLWVDEKDFGELNMSEGDRRIYDLLVKNSKGIFEVLVKYKNGNELEWFKFDKVYE